MGVSLRRGKKGRSAFRVGPGEMGDEHKAPKHGEFGGGIIYLLGCLSLGDVSILSYDLYRRACWALEAQDKLDRFLAIRDIIH